MCYYRLTARAQYQGTHWYEDGPRKRAAYSGHTDIGSLTYLAANPVGGLQVYGKDGWRDMAYIPNSIVVIMGDAMEFMTGGRMNGTLHRGEPLSLSLTLTGALPF